MVVEIEGVLKVLFLVYLWLGPLTGMDHSWVDYVIPYFGSDWLRVLRPLYWSFVGFDLPFVLGSSLPGWA